MDGHLCLSRASGAKKWRTLGRMVQPTHVARALLATALLACGSSKPTTTTTASGDTVAGDRAGEQASCEPGRCLDDIRAAIGEHRPQARACYDEGRKRQPDLAGGKIIINFTIAADGTVTDAEQGMQDDQITEPGVVDCVSEVIKQVRFAPSAKGKTSRAYHRFEFAAR
jgi:hypothetical protein